MPKPKSVIQLPRNQIAKPLESGLDVIQGVRELLNKFGAQVEPALYALLCDKKSPTRATVDKALKGGGASATTMLVPLLVAQFALAPAVAALVAAVAVQAIASTGQEKLCKELAESRKKDDGQKAKKPRRKQQAPKAKPTKPNRNLTKRPVRSQ